MIERRTFDIMPDGTPVTCYTIRNRAGEFVELLDLGATIHSIFVLDVNGKIGDVTLGATNAKDMSRHSFEGVTIGRCANRIAHGQFAIDGKTTQLECHSSGHYLHGGSGNYAYKRFRAEVDDQENAIHFHLRDTGEAGFTGNVDVRVSYTFGNDHALKIEYDMHTDSDTVLCPTNHAYFNLTGTGDIRDHELRILAETIAPKGDIGMPVGEIRSLKDTPADFRAYRKIGDAMQSNTMPGYTSGYFTKVPPVFDECFILEKDGFGLAAEVRSPKNGRHLKVFTDMPALILFTPAVQTPREGKNGAMYEGYCAYCLETQFVPNAVNCPTYQSPVFRKGQTLRSQTVYAFGVII